ncbi:MAG: PEGA domain-containing protein, partial [Spirochaetaceae bacterium]
AESAIFIGTAPLRAEVIVNGVPVGATPILLRDQEPGPYQISIRKPGYLPVDTVVELADASVESISVRLRPNTFVASFSADRTIAAGTPFERTAATLMLPEGQYELTGSGVDLILRPVYPHESALRAARIVTIAGAVVATISTIEDAFVIDGRSFFTSYLPTPGTIASWTLAIGAGGFWWALERDKARHLEQSVILPYDGGLTASEAERIFRDGDAALEAGNLSRALTQYNRILADSTDSEYLPQALYKAAQIYSVSGDGKLAARLLELLIDDLPAIDVYDRALFTLAQIYEQTGLFNRAAELLESMLFADPLFDPRDVESDLEALRERSGGAR